TAAPARHRAPAGIRCPAVRRPATPRSGRAIGQFRPLCPSCAGTPKTRKDRGARNPEGATNEKGPEGPLSVPLDFGVTREQIASPSPSRWLKNKPLLKRAYLSNQSW